MIFCTSGGWLLGLSLTLVAQARPAVKSSKPLTGRFLSISDIHLDYHYKSEKSINAACHAKKAENKEDRAGWFGSPATNCDSPSTLVDAIFHELDTRWKDQIDFVVWMGDNAR